MIVVTAEVREINHAGSHLLYAATDVPNADEAIGHTLLRVAALLGAVSEEPED